jgi:hypothetical protein
VGLPNGFAAAAIPAGTAGVAGAGGWAALGAASSLADHLIRNTAAALPAVATPANRFYTPSTTPPEPPGWAGPYVNSVPLDPWARPYVCNIRFILNGNVAGASVAETQNHAVMCLSAGPNGTWDTPLADATPLQIPAGDDIGWRIQTAQN